MVGALISKVNAVALRG